MLKEKHSDNASIQAASLQRTQGQNIIWKKKSYLHPLLSWISVAAKLKVFHSTAEVCPTAYITTLIYTVGVISLDLGVF